MEYKNVKSGKGKTDNRKLEMKILLGKEKKNNYRALCIVFCRIWPKNEGFVIWLEHLFHHINRLTCIDEPKGKLSKCQCQWLTETIPMPCHAYAYAYATWVLPMPMPMPMPMPCHAYATWVLARVELLAIRLRRRRPSLDQ